MKKQSRIILIIILLIILFAVAGLFIWDLNNDDGLGFDYSENGQFIQEPEITIDYNGNGFITWSIQDKCNINDYEKRIIETHESWGGGNTDCIFSDNITTCEKNISNWKMDNEQNWELRIAHNDCNAKSYTKEAYSRIIKFTY